MTLLLLLGWTVCRRAWFWTLSVIGIIVIPPLDRLSPGAVRKPDDVLLRQHLAAAAARPAGTSPRRHLRSRVCPTRRFSAWMRSCARSGGCWSRTGGFSNGIRRATRIEQPHGPGRLLPDDVDRPRPCHRRGRSIWRLSRPAALAGRAHPGPLVCLPRHRLVDQPAARSPRSTAVGRPDPLSPEAFPEDLGVLRNLRRPGRSLAAAGQLSGHPVAAVAHRTSPTNMGLALLANLSAYDFGYISAGQLIERTAKRSAPWKPWNGTGATSTTGTTPSP